MPVVTLCSSPTGVHALAEVAVLCPNARQRRQRGVDCSSSPVSTPTSATFDAAEGPPLPLIHTETSARRRCPSHAVK